MAPGCQPLRRPRRAPCPPGQSRVRHRPSPEPPVPGPRCGAGDPAESL